MGRPLRMEYLEVLSKLSNFYDTNLGLEDEDAETGEAGCARDSACTRSLFESIA